MVSAVVSLFLGVLPFVLPVPVILPVIGLALGANSLLKEKKKESSGQNKSIKIVSILGVVVCSAAVLLFFVGRAVSA